VSSFPAAPDPSRDAAGTDVVDDAHHGGVDVLTADPMTHPAPAPAEPDRRRRVREIAATELDPRQARPDPADQIVGVGEVPAISPPVGRRRLVLPPPPTDRARGWIVTGVLTFIGALVRLWELGYRTDGGTPLFDEKYYAVQAAEMVRNGGIEDNPAFNLVVHPPLGKQLIALGEMLFGYTPFGWRFDSAFAGTACIFLVIRIARRMTRSTLLGGIAGVLLICDGVSHVQSRTALLDIFVAVFALAAFSCVIVDRDQVRQRLVASFTTDADAPGAHSWAGVKLGARWWRFAAGVFLGLTVAVKWNGLYYIVAFGILVVIWDITARRAAGIRRPILAVVRRDLWFSIWSLAIMPVGIYIASWWAWFASESGWDRHAGGDANGFVGAVSSALKSMWTYSKETLKFHNNLLTPTNPADRHPWESKPWSWPIGTRPVLYYVSDSTSGCSADSCVKRIFLIGTPALWWISLFVLAWALWKAIGRLDWRYAAVMVGYGAGYLPWFVNLDRQMYFFYMTPVAAFLILGVTLVLGDVLGRARDGVEKRYTSMAIVGIYVGLVVANFVWLWPILMGDPITAARLTAETWLPSWG
jgi:dolichyl-phosphate-mannose--protein O-mannosyl transferase